MERTNEVTVVCTAYNHEKYIRDALNGFVSQRTSFPFEVIVHDDASTDQTAAIIREYEEKYPELIRPIYQIENQYVKHLGINRTIISPLVRSKYVAFCEGDDYWTDPLKLQKQYDFMEAHPEYTLCTCSTLWMDMKTSQISSKMVLEEDRDIPIEEIILETKGRPFQYASFFVRTDIWQQWPTWHKYFPVGDTPLALRAAVHGKVRMLADVMCVYRYRSTGSWTSRMADADNKVKQFQKMVEGYSAFEEASGGAYHELVSERIKRLKYHIAVAQGDLKAMLTGELRESFAGRSFIQKTNDICKCIAPGLYEYLIAVKRTRLYKALKQRK